jgi:hypothetical protein
MDITNRPLAVKLIEVIQSGELSNDDGMEFDGLKTNPHTPEEKILDGLLKVALEEAAVVTTP